MLFNSMDYLIFFPLVVLFYFVLPQKLRNIWLLIASYYFYMNWNVRYSLLLAGSTLVTYVVGLLISYFRQKGKTNLCKLALATGFVLNISILAFFKYANFLIENINQALEMIKFDTHVEAFDILLPVGISFYIFQALSYTMDVYRGEVKATKNVLKYALFVSFFPQLVAGPIERSKNLLKQFDKKHTFEVGRVHSGLLLMLWGLFMKIVIADTISPTVTMVYGNFEIYSGVEIILTTILFAFQIYCDFAGYSSIAIGSAKVLGFDLMQNFKSPYFAVSISDFWKRWHISLTSWFRDYLYIPLGGNRKGTLRKYVNVFIIFFVSGFWHGADWNFVAWGCINGTLMILEEVTVGLREKGRSFFKVDTSRFSYKLSVRLITFILIDFSWLFFRANGFKPALAMVKKIVTDLQIEKLFGYVFGSLGMNAQTMVILLAALILLMIVDYMKYKDIDVGALVFKQGIWFRWLVYLGLLFGIILFGAYGNIYEQTAFIYFQF